jgi:hypothetical protein
LGFQLKANNNQEIWLKHQFEQGLKKNQSFPPESSGAVGVAEESGAICEILSFAAFVFGSWQAAVKFPE